MKNKSLQKIDKKSLFEITLKFALKLKNINKVFVSTDDERVKKIASKYQCEIIDRPKKLALSSSPEILSWKHAVNIVQKKYSKKFFFISLPITAPLRKKVDVYKCMREVVTKKKDISINLLSLKKNKIINKNFSKLKILGTGELKTKIDITAHYASKQAQDKIAKTGGKINLIKK